MKGIPIKIKMLTPPPILRRNNGIFGCIEFGSVGADIFNTDVCMDVD